MAYKRALNIVGMNLRRLRRSIGLTQSDIAARCQVIGWQLSRETLAKIEAGYRRVNDAEVVMLARVLGKQVEELLIVSNDRLLEIARHSPACE